MLEFSSSCPCHTLGNSPEFKHVYRWGPKAVSVPILVIGMPTAVANDGYRYYRRMTGSPEISKSAFEICKYLQIEICFYLQIYLQIFADLSQDHEKSRTLQILLLEMQICNSKCRRNIYRICKYLFLKSLVPKNGATRAREKADGRKIWFYRSQWCTNSTALRSLFQVATHANL